MAIAKPDLRPANPYFSSGPCAKRPGWSLETLSGAFSAARTAPSERKARLAEVIDARARILGMPRRLPARHRPGSDTGAVEMALWSLLGARGVDVLAWESFGKGWATDVVKQLKLADVRVLIAPLRQAARSRRRSIPARDVVFTWNGTTSGVRVPERRLDRGRPRRA